jgi:hypothetical protein
MADHVDETRSDGQPGGIDLASAALRAEIADRRDAIVEDGEVGGSARRTGAVVNGPVADHDIVRRWSVAPREHEKRERDRQRRTAKN